MTEREATNEGRRHLGQPYGLLYLDRARKGALPQQSGALSLISPNYLLAVADGYAYRPDTSQSGSQAARCFIQALGQHMQNITPDVHESQARAAIEQSVDATVEDLTSLYQKLGNVECAFCVVQYVLFPSPRYVISSVGDCKASMVQGDMQRVVALNTPDRDRSTGVRTKSLGPNRKEVRHTTYVPTVMDRLLLLETRGSIDLPDRIKCQSLEPLKEKGQPLKKVVDYLDVASRSTLEPHDQAVAMASLSPFLYVS